MAPEAPTRVAGYDLEQIANAAIIADVARSLGLGDRGALLGVMCAMGESSLRNIDYGDWETSGVRNPDGTPTTSIGLFQQQASWGSVADRMDPIYAAWAFYRALVRVKDWATIAPTLAINRTQINADPNHYAKYEAPARAVLAAIPGLRAKGDIVADPMQVIEIPWQPGMYAVRALVDKLIDAGRPRINSAHRVYQDQKNAWDAYQAGRGNPADNPDRPDLYELGHVRAAAVDIDATAENVRRLKAVGLVRPFSWEDWHWRLPGDVRRFPLLFSLPSTASSGATPIPKPPTEEEILMGAADDIVNRVNADTRKIVKEEVAAAFSRRGGYDKYSIINFADDNGRIDLVNTTNGKSIRIESPYHVTLIRRYFDNTGDDPMLTAEVDIVQNRYLKPID